MALHKLCRAADIPEEGWKVFTVENRVDVLVGRKNGQLFAFNNSCPHRGASLSKGHFNGDNIVCYMHGYEYNVFTGRLEKMASWKKEDTWVEQSPEWRRSGDLVIYPLQVEQDGWVCVSI
jgi:nitrite reductase/ring-hydroxylating ferredoxin subunit